MYNQVNAINWYIILIDAYLTKLKSDQHFFLLTFYFILYFKIKIQQEIKIRKGPKKGGRNRR